VQLGRWRLRLLHQRNHVCRQVFRTERCARERLRLALHSPASGQRRKPATLLDDASQSAGFGLAESIPRAQSALRNATHRAQCTHCRRSRTSCRGRVQCEFKTALTCDAARNAEGMLHRSMLKGAPWEHRGGCTPPLH
jgi:hypothetical protein